MEDTSPNPLNNQSAEQMPIPEESQQPVAPKPAGRSKKKLIIAIVIVLIALAGAAAAYFLVIKKDKQPAVSQEDTSDNVPEEIEFSLNVPEYAKVNYSTNPNGAHVALTKDGVKVLERTEYDWTGYASAYGWLYFSSLDPAKNPREPNGYQETPHKYDLHAFNYATGEFKVLGEATAPEYSSLNSIKQLSDGYMYFEMGGYRTGTSILRCKIDEATACGNLENFYEKSGSSLSGTVYYGDGQYFIVGSFGDAGISGQNAWLYNPETKKETEIESVGSEMGEGSYLHLVDDKGRLWISEFAGEVEGESGAGDEHLVRLYAIDKTGKVVKTYAKADVSIDANYARIRDAGSSSIYLVKDKRAVAFDTLTDKFGEETDFDPSYSGPLSDDLGGLKKVVGILGGYELVITKVRE